MFFMYQEKTGKNDKEKTSDQLSNSAIINYPDYLENIKFNLQSFMPAYNVCVVQKKSELYQDQEYKSGQFSIIITCPTVFKQRFQIFTETFLDQKSFSFYTKHLVTLNHNQLKIQNRQTLSLNLNLCDKINTYLQIFRLIIHPLSGKVYFQTKAMINQASLTHLKKQIPRKDCYYTEIIVKSTKKAQNYLDLLLFVSGHIQLNQLLQNQIISKEFPFFRQSHQILNQLEKNLFYLSFVNLNQKVNLNSNKNIKIVEYNISPNYQNNWGKSHKQESIKYKSQPQQGQRRLVKAKSTIINKSLQYFPKNTQSLIQIFTSRNPYGNIDFTESPFQMSKKLRGKDQTALEFEKSQALSNKKILSYIQIQKQYNQQFAEQKRQWVPISEGGFGIIQLGKVNFINLSASYSSPEGFAFVNQQQMIRKRDKNVKKNKIQRQRKILQRLRLFNHPNIMSFYISFQEEYQSCIFSNYTPNMSLDLYLKKNQLSINLDRKMFFIIQAIEGLLFLHDRRIVHLDIKPGNMLINKQLRLLLSDFGQAFIIGQDDPIQHDHAYTIPYCAPQIFLNQAQLTQKADIYAIGVCIIKIIMGSDFCQTFLKTRFIKRLSRNDILKVGLGQKYQGSIIYPILRIIAFVAYKAVDELSKLRPQLQWIRQVLNQCRNFIYKLIH